MQNKNKTNPGVLYKLCGSTTDFDLKNHYLVIEKYKRKNNTPF